MAITLFGSVPFPADGAAATNTATANTITPPASMVVGDLVVVYLQQRGTATMSVTTTGGQLWQSFTRRTTTNIAVQGFWCRFNGTWAVNPVFTFSAGTCTSGLMQVYRPSASGYAWGIDQAEASATFTAPSTPFTITRTGVTTTNASTVTLAGFFTADDNEWNTLSGSGWSNTSLSAQYRNTSGTDQSFSFAYNIKTSAGATNNVSLNQATLGGDAGLTTIVSFYEYDPGALYPSQIVTSSGTGNRTAAIVSAPASSLLIVSITTEDDSDTTPGDATITDTATLTWTKRVDAQSSDGANTQIWTAPFSAGGNTTITGAWNTTNKSMVAYVVTGHETTPAGASNTGLNQLNPSVNITTGRNNSLVICVTGDWTAQATAQTYRNAETEVLYHNAAGAYTGYHYFKIIPTAGSQTFGLTAPNMDGTPVDGGNTAVYEIRLPVGTSDAAGSAAGTSTAAAVPTVNSNVAGAANGAATAVALAGARADVAGAANGTSTATAITIATTNVAGVAAGIATVEALTTSRHDSAGTAAGTSTSSAIPAISADVSGSSAGTSAAVALAQATVNAAGAAAGTSTAQSLSTETHNTAGSAEGVSTAQALAEITWNVAGATTGTSSAIALSTQVINVAGVAAGTSDASAIATVRADVIGSAAGISTAIAVIGGTTVNAAGSAAGVSTASANASSTADTTGQAAGNSFGAAVCIQQADCTAEVAGIAIASAVAEVQADVSGFATGTSAAAALAEMVFTVFTSGSAAGGSTAEAFAQSVIIGYTVMALDSKMQAGLPMNSEIPNEMILKSTLSNIAAKQTIIPGEVILNSKIASSL